MTLRFYFDECVSFRLAEALSALEEDRDVVIRNFYQEFPEGLPTGEGDSPWIEALARRGHWYVITRDELYKVPQQRASLTSTGFNVFYLRKAWRNFDHWKMATKLTAAWPYIKGAAKRAKKGESFWVGPDIGKKLIERM